MTSIGEQIRAEIEALVREGYDILASEAVEVQARQKTGSERQITISARKQGSVVSSSLANYQSWYTRALPVVKQLLPERYQEFQELYRPTKRNEQKISAATYTISDYLGGLRITNSYSGKEVFDHFASFLSNLDSQIKIIDSASKRIDSILSDIRGVLEAELFDDEVEAANELLKKGHLRASGTVAGVLLERHLARVCENHGITIKKKAPTISDLNDAVKNGQVFDVPTWRFVQRLGDIRNLCSHAKDREPTRDEVDELIRGAQKVIKTVF